MAIAQKAALAKVIQQKKSEPEFPQDMNAMKAYSLAIAQSAENNEPEEPINYSQNSAQQE